MLKMVLKLYQIGLETLMKGSDFTFDCVLNYIVLIKIINL